MHLSVAASCGDPTRCLGARHLASAVSHPRATTK